jgi:hypothetical protein
MQNGKELWISQIYFPMENLVDWAAQLESIVDRSGADMRAWWHLAVARRAGSRARRCSLAMVEEDEMDEAVLEGCSLEHEWWQRAVATEVKNGGGLSSARGRRRGSSGERGKRGGEGEGCSSHFIGAEGVLGRCG